jgi:hypothetical protein
MNGQLNDRARRPGQVRNDEKRPGGRSSLPKLPIYIFFLKKSCQYTQVESFARIDPLHNDTGS